MWFWRHKKVSLVLLIVIIGAIVFLTRRNGNGKLDQATVSRGDVAEEMVLSGVVAAEEHAKMSFPASGRLSWVKAKEGQTVNKGEPLMAIDTTAYVSALNRAEADLRAAEANVAAVYDSLQGKENTETFAEINTRTAAEAAKDKTYDLLLVAQSNLRDATLVAPFGGIVTYVANPFSGVNITAAVTQVEIINPETIHFEVAADQSEVVDIKDGEKVKIILDATDEEIIGTVTRISYTTVPGEVGSVYSVNIEFDGELREDFTYRVGMTGDAHFVLSEKKDVVFVPSEFVKSDSQGDYVLINEGKEKAYIEIGLEGEERTEVISGIGEGVLIYD